MAKRRINRHSERMLLVHAPAEGAVAFARMTRDGVITRLTRECAVPRDVHLVPALRAAAIAHVVPAHTVLTGEAALWVQCGGAPPRYADLVGVRGLHRAAPGYSPGGWRLHFHSGPAAHEQHQVLWGVRVANPSRAAVDALRWGTLESALPRIRSLLLAGGLETTALANLVIAADPRGAHVQRAVSAWRALEASMADTTAKACETP